MSKDVVVIVPLYKKNLLRIESPVLSTNLLKLSRYKRIAICPVNFDLTDYQNYNFDDVVFFEERFFENLEGYNRLLRSSIFYERFIEYDFILIVQTDALIFGESLDYFIEKDYDYWGAPWIDYELINYSFLKDFLPFLHKYKFLKPFRKFSHNRYLVGNGGLSLRRVKVHAEVTSRYHKEIRDFESDYNLWIKGGAQSMMEDVFWSLYVSRFYPSFKIAPWREALKFSFEMSPRKAFALNGRQMPLGCHAFQKVDPYFFDKFVDFNLLV